MHGRPNSFQIMSWGSGLILPAHTLREISRLWTDIKLARLWHAAKSDLIASDKRTHNSNDMAILDRIGACASSPTWERVPAPKPQMKSSVLDPVGRGLAD